MSNLNYSRTSAALLCAAALLPASLRSALAEVRYVDLNSASPTPPYTNCTTAATNIQDAVNAAVAGDEIVVTNGIYATGGPPGNRVTVDKPTSLRSVNGPQELDRKTQNFRQLSARAGRDLPGAVGGRVG